MLTFATRSETLAPFFAPRGVALIGASRDSLKLSNAVLRNLLNPAAAYPGPIYPVNPHADEILGKRCYPHIEAVPDPVELAILVIPAERVAEEVEACGRRGLKAVLVISGGFREVGPEGVAREREVIEIARRYGMRVMGPNGIGVIDTSTPLNTTFVPGVPARGNIAFLSQSGALCGGIIDWIVGRGIGFSRLLSVGNEADVNETDLLPCLAEDDHTRVVTLYLEDVKDGSGFIEALRTTTARKPVLAIKAGRTTSGQAATASHTGALAGAHAAFSAVCRQAGAIECDTVKALFDNAVALAYQPPLTGQRIAILTNAGGPAALAADGMEPLGLTLARTSPAVQAALHTFLQPAAQVTGPVDMLGGATDQEYRQAFEALLGDDGNDGLLVILVPQLLVDPVSVVQSLAEVSRLHPQQRKPVVLCLMGEASLREAFAAAHVHQIPPFTFPDEAIAALGALHQRAQWLATSHPSPSMPGGMDVERAATLLAGAKANGQRILDAVAACEVLQTAGIAVAQDQLATTVDEAATFARILGFPVVLKLVSPDLTHKTDIGGVLLAIQDEASARAGFQTLLDRAHAANPQAVVRGVQVQRMISGGQEVILGIKRDPTFGPLVMFGMGGIYAEALADVSFRLAPMSRADAEEMIAEVRSAKILSGLRGLPSADTKALIDALVRLSWLAHACPEIGELDINPLLVLPEGQGVIAVDARIGTV